MSVFDFDGTFWDAVGQALDGEIAEEWQSGAISLSMDGSILAISAAGTESETGSVRVHSTWTQKGQSLVGESFNCMYGYARLVGPLNEKVRG